MLNTKGFELVKNTSFLAIYKCFPRLSRGQVIHYLSTVNHRLVVVYLDPMPVRVLEVDLFYAVYSNGWRFCISRPIGVLDFQLV